MLGIALGERSMLVAEVHASSAGPQVVKAAEFTYPEGQNLTKDPAALGASLGQFLKEQHFGVRNAVVGLPARWVLSKTKEVPAIQDNLLADTLRLQAESEFSSELGELVYDYAGTGNAATASTGGTTSVLLVAVPKRHLDQVSQLAESARVRVHAVTPFSAALAASAKAAANAMTVVLGPWGVEFTAQDGGNPRVLRYVGTSADSAPTLLGELRRASTRMPRGATAAAGGDGASAQEIFLWNDSGADESSLQSIGQSLELSVRDGQLGDLGVSAAPGVMNGRDFATPISLAVAGMAPARGTVDFLDSRLAPPPEKRVDRRTVAAVLVVLLLGAGAALWYTNIQKRQAEVDTIVKANIERNPQRSAAEATVKRIQLAQRWHSDKPKFVACLTDLTEIVPTTSDIYGTNFNLKDDVAETPTPGAPANPSKVKNLIMRGDLMGKATNENVVIALAQKLNASKRFKDAKVGNINRSGLQAGGRGPTEISFVINFTYVPR